MSQNPNKSLQKMCKSPKNSNFQIKQEKIDYENMSTNCTVVGSNNLNLVKKPQLMTNMSPAYSNPSPNYHPQSPYSSPASLKSPSPNLKPPTPQPNFPVMQIIHNNLITRPIQTSQPQNIIKLKPHLNILPKPSASPQPSPKPSVSPQIVIPAVSQAAAAATATLMPTAQPLLLNQMPMLAAPGVQFILRPQTAASMTAAGPKLQATSQAPQGLILQPACATQQLLQLGAPARSQPMVRVLTNGVQLAPSSTTYVTTQMANQPINATHIQQTIVNNNQQQQHHQQQQHQSQQMQLQQQLFKKKPKVKMKKKIDLANIMKLSGIGDEDDIQFESDTSQSESEHNSVPTTPQPQTVTPTIGSIQQHNSQSGFVQADAKKNIQNIQISAMSQPTINATTPVVQVVNQNFQSGMISNGSSQVAAAAAAAAAAQAGGGLPFNSTFITPNFTINNGLMLQRSGGFKLTVGEDGRLVLQHDPTLNQDLQSQLILQSLLGLNGGLVLQPSMDQQTVQQTVQTIQQQSVQTIQQQTVQSQTIQTVQQQTVQPQVQHTIQSLQPQIQQQTVQQTIQHQTVNALQQPMQIVQPQPIHSLHSQVQPTVHSISQSQVHNLQSQIQSLLQQQNVAVQAQTVHQNIPQNVHSQAIQSVTQNVQNVQNLAQSSVVAQNVQNLSQSSVQNVMAQNLAAAAAAQSSAVQNVVAQNLAAQNAVQSLAQNVVAQNMAAAAATVQTSVQNVVSQNMSQSASVQNAVAQNISAQNVVTQNLNQQNVTSVAAQPAQSSVHSVQGFQQAHTQTTQPILKVQPFQKSQPPVQTVQPIQHQSHQQHNLQENHPNPPSNPTSYVVNLTPEQLEQLKRNGQVTVNGQTIFMQRPNKDQGDKKLSPKTKPVKKVSEIHKIQGIKSILQDNSQGDAVIERNSTLKSSIEQIKSPPPPPPQNVKPLSSPIMTTQPIKQHILPHGHVQPIQTKPQQPQAMVQPSVQQHQIKLERQKSPISSPKQQKVSPTIHSLQDSNGANASHEVDKLLGQILEESNTTTTTNNNNNNNSNNNNGHNIDRQPQQRITTIQLTPQKQQHLKTIQMQIQSLSARLQPGDTEVHNALKALFSEQQKILASGKLLPPDKVYYLNNQLTIVNPSSLNLPSPSSSVKSEPPSSGLSSSHQTLPKSTSAADVTSTSTIYQPISTLSHNSPRVSVSVSTSTGDLHSHSTVHHHPTPTHHHHIGTAAHHHHHHNQSGSPVTVVTSHQSVLAQPTSHVVVSHPNHVMSQRLNAIGQVTQLSPLYSKQSLHSPQLHSPQLHSPQLHSPKLQSPQPPNAQQQLHNSIPQTSTSQQQHGIATAIQQHHVQQNLNAQVAKAKQPSPSPQQQQQHQQQQQQVKNQHLNLSQQSPIHLFQQQNFHQQQNIQQQLISQKQQPQNIAIHHQQVHKQQAVPAVSHQQQFSLAKKAQLIETQLNRDQQDATKPDVHRPFRDKRDACARLIRYHCFDQPILSSQDLDKADEIFELTARHFIAKFDKMTDKYKYLLMKESMRQVQTSELMMLDRMFLADEQQSLIRLREDYKTELINYVKEQPSPDSGTSVVVRSEQQKQQQQQQQLQPSSGIQVDKEQETQQESVQSNELDSAGEEYDEWACIQRELGCLPDSKDMSSHHHHHHQQQQHQQQQLPYTVHNNHHHHHHLSQQQSLALQQHLQSSSQQSIQHNNNLKRTSSSDSRLETLKRFRVDKHTKKHDSVVVVNNSVQQGCGGGGVGGGGSGGHAGSVMAAAGSPIRDGGRCGYESNTSSQANSSYGSCKEEESENNSIDEQVQSAINSILNLQQSNAQLQQQQQQQQNSLDLDSILS